MEQLEYPNLPPEDAVCESHPDRPAEYERVVGMGIAPEYAEAFGDGGAYLQTEWVCVDCAD